MIGRTITGVEEGKWGDQLLRLDNGTAIEISVQNYGDDLVVTHLTDAVLAQRAIDAEKERVEREKQRRRSERARKKRVRHMDQMRKELSAGAFEGWRRETYPTTTEVIRDVWSGPSIVEQFAASSPLMERFNDSR